VEFGGVRLEDTLDSHETLDEEGLGVLHVAVLLLSAGDGVSENEMTYEEAHKCDTLTSSAHIVTLETNELTHHEKTLHSLLCLCQIIVFDGGSDELALLVLGLKELISQQ
jgi:hypothetical protein